MLLPRSLALRPTDRIAVTTTRPNAVEVAVPLPVRGTFTYALPEVDADVLLGTRVAVSFGPRRLTGFVVATSIVEDTSALKPILAVLDNDALLVPTLVELARRIAKRYMCGLGEALAALVPGGVKRGSAGRKTAYARALMPAAQAALDAWERKPSTEKQLMVLKALVLAAPEALPRQTLLADLRTTASPLETLVKRGLAAVSYAHEVDDPFSGLEIRPSIAPVPTDEQQKAAATLGAAIERRAYAPFLLEGITGSGKTEVYLDAIAKTLSMGRGAIVMVPEISLTPQTIERFASRFGDVAVLHSHMTDAARARQWADLRSGRKKIAVGPRSAVFAPISDLGLIVLDEEHESTFKQQNTPRYHARDAALMRGEIDGAVVILGSATPSLESFAAAEDGRIGHLVLTKRAGGAALPAVSIIDLRAERPVGPGGLFTPVLANMISRALDQDEGVLLFLNRRGFNTSSLCRRCGHVVRCDNCSIPLVYYKAARRLLCHYCGHVRAPLAFCLACNAKGLAYSGHGTESVEHAARMLFPKARIARMDGESMRGKSAHETLFRQLKNHEIDILIGTQMAAKGLDLPRITLIGVISADTSLLVPDFRSAERTFQLMTQVAGRAGRGAKAGRVVVQTFMPDHYALRAAARHDFRAFAAAELPYRREAGYPPYGHLLRIVAQGVDEARVVKALETAARELTPGAAEAGIDVLGPAPAPISLLNKKYRHHLVLRADRGEALERLMESSAWKPRTDKAVQILIDRDPAAMM